jgi:uncharacterized delta-60 repeat protein
MAAASASRLRRIVLLGLLATLPLGGRALAAGELDPAFGSGGKVVTPYPLSNVDAKDVLITSAGDVVVAGGIAVPNLFVGYGFLARYDGTGAGGIDQIVSLGTHDGGFRAIAQQSDNGALVLAGFAQDSSGGLEGIIARFAGGGPDVTFGTGGIVRTPLGSADGAFDDVLIDADGNYVVVGSIDQGGFEHGVIARYLPDGTLDTSFASTGMIVTGLTNVRFDAVALQPDGKLVAVGSLDAGGGKDVLVARFDAGGTLDGTFNGGGLAVTPVYTEDDEATAVLVQPDDKLVVSATSHTSVIAVDRPSLIRYLPDGTLDSTFASGGILQGFLVGGGTTADDVLRQPDGKLVAVGLGDSLQRHGYVVMRFEDDGTPDATFGAGGGTFIDVGPLTDLSVVAVARQADAKLVVAGTTDDGSTGLVDTGVIRVYGEGSPPPTTTSVTTTSVTTTTGASTTTVFIPTTLHSTVTTSTTTSSTSTTTQPGCSCANPCEVCDGVNGCHVPDVAGCVTAFAHKASLVLRDDPNPARDRVTWKWKSGASVAPGDFGNPTTTDAYALCVFDRPGGVPSGKLALQVSAAGTCGALPCWKTVGGGFKYNDPTMAADGLRSLHLKSGEAGRAKVNVKGKGSGLAMPALDLDAPVTARLVRIGTGACWEATFSAPTRNEAATFKARN